MLKKKLLNIAVAIALAGSINVYAETIDANGKTEISIKSSGGDLVAARKLARDSAERDAVYSALKVRMNLDPNNPAIKNALDEMAKQLSDNMKTDFVTEGDILTAKTKLSIDSGQLFELAGSFKGLVSSTATASAKIIFLIDEYYGIATSLDPSQPISTEVSYSHDKSKASASSSSASASAKSSVAVSGKESSSLAASDSASVSARDSASIAARDRGSVAGRDGYGNAGAASSDSSVAGSRDAKLDASRKSSVAANSSSSYAGAASEESASASASASSSSQKDIVNYSFKQKFPDTNNAKPADDKDALITARLEQMIAPFSLKYTPERDIRFDVKGKKLLISDIEKQRKFDTYTQKASKQPFSAKYIVFGTAALSKEGKTPSGDVSCSGYLKLTSFNVDSGEGLVSALLGKRAQGSTDQDCQTNLASALATEVASTIGNSASKQLQKAATQGESFYVTLYSAKKILPAIRKEFTKNLQGLTSEFKEDDATDNARTFIVQASGNFKTKIEDMMDDMAGANPEMKKAKLVVKGNRLAVCLEGTCPKDF